MPSTKEIKTHMESVGETRKITNAMYLIASTKLRRARQELENTRPYFEALQGEIKRIFRTVSDVESPYFYPVGDDSPIKGTYGCLVITADKGLMAAGKERVTADKGPITADKGLMAAGKERVTAGKGPITTGKEQQRVREMILATYRFLDCQALNLRFLAGQVLYRNEEYLGRSFQKVMGCRYPAWLIGRRVGLAKRFL